MYYPYFRGKQFELIAIRETAKAMADSGFTPIIEPVKEALAGLERTLAAVRNENGQAIVIVNPHHGNYPKNESGISALLREDFADYPGIQAAILLREDTSLEQAVSLCNAHADSQLTLIHAGFTDAQALSSSIKSSGNNPHNVFFESYCGKLYRKHFRDSRRVLLRDGFERRRNADHPYLEPFSDLHITFEEEGMDGFGDFLIVGDDFLESGGPAYAIAIHLTFTDPSQDDAMFIHHFVSDRKDTPTDPAGKFAEALEKLITKIDEPRSAIFATSAVEEFRQLHARRHFPGLGHVKKLSMKHHIETLQHYFAAS